MNRFLIVAVSGLILYAGIELRAGSWLFVSLLREKTIVTFERDVDSGALRRSAANECPAEPAFLSASPDGRTLFASFRSTGELASFRIGKDGRLEAISVVEGGADPAYLLTDKTGRYLLSSYYLANKVTVHKLGRDGSISTKPLQSIPTADKAHGFAIDSQNAMAFVPHTGANAIFQFRFDGRTGRLSASEPSFIAAAAGDHPRHLQLHPSDRWAYVSNEAGDGLGVYAVDRTTATLKHLQTLSSIPEDFDGAKNATARCELTPDGRFAYVANRGHDSIAGFAIDQRTGMATALGQTKTEQTPRSFTIDPKGRFLYVAGQGSGRVAIYRIQKSGTLERLDVVESGPVSWWALAMDSPD